MPYTAAVITISDKGSRGERVDTSGPAICEMIKEKGYEVIYTSIIPDERDQIEAELIKCADELKASLAEYVELPDYNSGFMELRQGSVDAIAADLGVATYQISVNDGEYVILEEPLSREQYAVGFLLGNTELAEAVNTELHKMADDGTMLEIAKKYEDVGLDLDSLCMINN